MRSAVSSRYGTQDLRAIEGRVEGAEKGTLGRRDPNAEARLGERNRER
jgi:hypothetical protein